MHAPDGADHVAAFVLALQRVAGTLQELDVPIAADDHVQRAVRRGVHEEPDVARVEPVVAAGDHDPRRARRRRGGVDGREPGAIREGHRVPLHAVLTGGVAGCGIRVLGPHDQARLLRSQPGHLGVPRTGRRSRRSSPSEATRPGTAAPRPGTGAGTRSAPRPAGRTGRGRGGVRGGPPPGGSERPPTADCPGVDSTTTAARAGTGIEPGSPRPSSLACAVTRSAPRSGRSRAGRPRTRRPGSRPRTRSTSRPGSRTRRPPAGREGRW